MTKYRERHLYSVEQTEVALTVPWYRDLGMNYDLKTMDKNMLK